MLLSLVVILFRMDQVVPLEYLHVAFYVKPYCHTHKIRLSSVQLNLQDQSDIFGFLKQDIVSGCIFGDVS